jgi:hypothetical protein
VVRKCLTYILRASPILGTYIGTHGYNKLTMVCTFRALLEMLSQDRDKADKNVLIELHNRNIRIKTCLQSIRISMVFSTEHIPVLLFRESRVVHHLNVS